MQLMRLEGRGKGRGGGGAKGKPFLENMNCLGDAVVFESEPS